MTLRVGQSKHYSCSKNNDMHQKSMRNEHWIIVIPKVVPQFQYTAIDLNSSKSESFHPLSKCDTIPAIMSRKKKATRLKKNYDLNFS